MHGAPLNRAGSCFIGTTELPREPNSLMALVHKGECNREQEGYAFLYPVYTSHLKSRLGQ